MKDDEEDDEAGSLKDFIDDGSSEEEGGSDSDIQELDELGEERKKTTTRQDKVGQTNKTGLVNENEQEIKKVFPFFLGRFLG